MLLFNLLFFCVFSILVACAEDFYQLLGINKDATDREIKKAYRTLSKKYHPDKNPGDETASQRFVAIAEAYEALIEPETRKVYDQYGHEGLQQHKQGGGRGGHHHDPFDLFSRFFGGSGHFGGQGQRQGPSMEVRLAVPLRDFYTGRRTEFSIEKQAICSACEGSGSKDGQHEECHTCGGRGVRIQKHMLAPGMFQHVQSVCDACGGRGKTVKHACPVCQGKRVVREPETFDVEIERGMPKGARVTYENEAEESPDWVAGDLHVFLSEQEPELSNQDEAGETPSRTDGTFFRRRGKDLLWREVLSLREAWMGDWTRNLTHLDGHVVKLSRKRGQVIQPNHVEIVPNEGMPIWKTEHNDDGEKFGDLLVEYVVVLPDQMESGMEKEFFAVWDKWRRKKGVDLAADSGRPDPAEQAKKHDEL